MIFFSAKFKTVLILFFSLLLIGNIAFAGDITDTITGQKFCTQLSPPDALGSSECGPYIKCIACANTEGVRIDCDTTTSRNDGICKNPIASGIYPIEFTSYAGETSAELICSITNLVSKTLLPPIAVLMALVVGFLFLTSQGEPQKITLATKVLYATLIGVFLLLVAPGIIALINDLFISDGVNLKSPVCGTTVATSTIIQALLNLVNLFAWFSAVVAVAMGLYSGFLYLTARGNPQQARQATLVFSYTIIGIAVSIVAFSIIAIAQQFIGYP